MSQCKGRYADKECSFKNGILYYTEKRCVGKVAGDKEVPDLCKWCIPKATTLFDPTNQRYLYQGKVGEEYFKKSHLFGSPWFLRRNEHEDYTISQEEFAAAKQAQRNAVVGMQMPGRKKKDNAAAPADATTPAKKPRAPRKPKAVAAPAPAPIASVQTPVAVEAPDEPLEALEVVKIRVHLKTIGEKSYWYDSKKSKVYEKTKDQGIGKYLGRYESAEEKIVEFPDSDVDV